MSQKECSDRQYEVHFFYFFLTADRKYTTEHRDLIFIMRLINKNTKKIPLQKNNLLLVGCKKKKRNIISIFTIKGTTLTLVTTWRREPAALNLLFFLFIFFHTPSENTEMLQREVSDSTWKEKKKRNNLYINRRWL